jgi:putative hemolysin
MNRLISALTIGVFLGLAACAADSTVAPDLPESPGTLPNVATEYCLEQGYQLTINTDAGGTTAYCLFPDGSRCELWAFYHRECPGPEDSR